jgi:DNA gyrase subunit A
MEHVKGPDFPTKGIIMGRSGIRAAYATGRGKVVVRARTEFEEYGQNRTRIIVTELPYQVNKRQLIKNIAEQVKDKRLDGISDLRDETDRNGMRMVIELKKDANPQVVLNKLFKQTAMQSNFSIIMLALVDNQKQPKILSLRHILDEYIAFQEQIIIRRTQYDLRKAQERAHLLEGLLIAQDNIDEVIKIIRNSYNDAKENLMARFGLDEVQAQAICDMRLIALQGLNREKLEAEYKELEERIAYYNELLGSEEMLRGVLKEELQAIADKYGDDRLTEIQDVVDEIDIEDLIEEEDCCYTMSEAGYIKRMPVDTYRSQKRGGRGISAQSLKDEDYVKSLFIASTHDYLLFFTNRGRVHRRKGYQIPEASRTARGTAIVNILPLEQDEKVTAMVLTRTFDDNECLMMVTRNGTVKRLRLDAINTARKAGIRALTLDEGDELIAVLKTDGHQNILIATRNGMAICFDENDVRPMGRDAAGVRGIRLDDGDYVVGATLADTSKCLLTVTEKGYGKRTAVDEYLRGGENDDTRQPQKRGGKGLKNYNLTEKTGKVAGVCLVSDDQDVMLIADDGTIIRMAASDINTYSRVAQGVIVMRPDEGSHVIAVETTDREEEPTETGETTEA